MQQGVKMSLQELIRAAQSTVVDKKKTG